MTGVVLRFLLEKSNYFPSAVRIRFPTLLNAFPKTICPARKIVCTKNDVTFWRCRSPEKDILKFKNQRRPSNPIWCGSTWLSNDEWSNGGPGLRSSLILCNNDLLHFCRN